jgi:hypothetical protein
MPPSNVHTIAMTPISTIDWMTGSMPSACCTGAKNEGPSTTSSTTAVRYTRDDCARMPPSENSAVVTFFTAAPSLWPM